MTAPLAIFPRYPAGSLRGAAITSIKLHLMPDALKPDG